MSSICKTNFKSGNSEMLFLKEENMTTTVHLLGRCCKELIVKIPEGFAGRIVLQLASSKEEALTELKGTRVHVEENHQDSGSPGSGGPPNSGNPNSGG